MPENYFFEFAETKIRVHPSWVPIFSENQEKLQEIGERIKGEDFEPPPERVFVIFQKPKASRRIIIMGQDPYPQPGTATGRSFEVKGYESWQEKTKNASLRNILKELYRESRRLKSCPSLREVRQNLPQVPEILPPAELFQAWEKQGVFFLNTALTVRRGEPGSHQQLWQGFIRAVIAALAGSAQQKYWLLWGRKAQKYSDLIRAEVRVDLEKPEGEKKRKNMIITAPHPSRYDFVGSGTFSYPAIREVCLHQGGEDSARQSATTIL